MIATIQEDGGEIRYQFTPDMREISGFGGGYESTCRAMLAAGLSWLDDHPDASPEFKGFPGIYGVISEENDDAKAMTQAVIDAAEGDCTGAMHQATISAVLWIKANGWDAYVAKMSHPRGRVGILEDKVAELEEDLSRVRDRAAKNDAELAKRGAIIAEKLLGWIKHPTHEGSREQMAYGPSAEYVLERIRPGDWLSRFVNEAIDGMTDPSEDVAG